MSLKKKNNDGEVRRIFFLQYCVLFGRMIEKENFFVDHSISDEKKKNNFINNKRKCPKTTPWRNVHVFSGN